MKTHSTETGKNVMSTIAQLESRLNRLESEKARVENSLDNFDPQDYTDESQYDDMLDEVNDEVSVGSLTFSPSRVLKELDPIAYNVGFSEYCETLDKEDFSAYNELCEELEELSDDIETLENELEELREELEENE